MPAANAGKPASDRWDTPPMDVLVSRQVSWLAGRRFSRVFPAPFGASDLEFGRNSLLTVAGAAPE
jgi:hypothetical protein